MILQHRWGISSLPEWLVVADSSGSAATPVLSGVTDVPVANCGAGLCGCCCAARIAGAADVRPCAVFTFVAAFPITGRYRTRMTLPQAVLLRRIRMGLPQCEISGPALRLRHLKNSVPDFPSASLYPLSGSREVLLLPRNFGSRRSANDRHYRPTWRQVPLAPELSRLPARPPVPGLCAVLRFKELVLGRRADAAAWRAWNLVHCP
jgi:hypothetical protein